jgi:hypothetical protein
LSENYFKGVFMKNFIATIALTLSLTAVADASNTTMPEYTEGMTTEQQRMEETKTKMKTSDDGTVRAMEKTTTKETPMMDSTMEKDSTSTHKKMKKVR